MGFVDCICWNRRKMDFSAMQFIISVALHVCPLICATKEKQTTMVTVLHQIKKSKITPFLKTLYSISKDLYTSVGMDFPSPAIDGIEWLRYVMYSICSAPLSFSLGNNASTNLLTILNGYSPSNRCCCTNISLSMLIFEFTHLHY